jgi:hypothetical protein
VDGWLGLIPCHTGEALVLSGDVGGITWIPSALQSGGMLVQRIFGDDEAIADALRSQAIENTLNSPAVEQVTFTTPPSGSLRLFDSSERGDMLQGASEVMHLVPGTYTVRAGFLETSSSAFVVRRFSPA